MIESESKSKSKEELFKGKAETWWNRLGPRLSVFIMPDGIFMKKRIVEGNSYRFEGIGSNGEDVVVTEGPTGRVKVTGSISNSNYSEIVFGSDTSHNFLVGEGKNCVGVTVRNGDDQEAYRDARQKKEEVELKCAIRQHEKHEKDEEANRKGSGNLKNKPKEREDDTLVGQLRKNLLKIASKLPLKGW